MRLLPPPRFSRPHLRAPVPHAHSVLRLQASVTKSKKKKQRKKTAADKARAAAAEADKTTAWQARIHARMEALVLQDVERRKREVAALKNAGAAVVALHPVAVATVRPPSFLPSYLLGLYRG